MLQTEAQAGQTRMWPRGGRNQTAPSSQIKTLFFYNTHTVTCPRVEGSTGCHQRESGNSSLNHLSTMNSLGDLSWALRFPPLEGAWHPASLREVWWSSSTPWMKKMLHEPMHYSNTQFFSCLATSVNRLREGRAADFAAPGCCGYAKEASVVVGRTGLCG